MTVKGVLQSADEMSHAIKVSHKITTNSNVNLSSMLNSNAAKNSLVCLDGNALITNSKCNEAVFEKRHHNTKHKVKTTEKS